jgi:L-iditol 2-dehydrogenase
MEAAVLIGPERLEYRDVETPSEGPGECTVRPRAVGICGTDLRLFDGTIPVGYPRILGHEIVGDVVGGPKGFIGTRVLVDPSVACGQCDRCREGRENLCSDGWFLGRDRDGGMSDLVVVPVANAHAIPDGLEDGAATLIQVLTTCVHGQRMSPISSGESVTIIGMGVTGLLHLQLAKLAGARPIVCTTRSASKLELARELGADAVVPAGDQQALHRLLELTGGGADIVIECAGSVATLAEAVQVTRYGGRIIAYGTIPETEGPFPFYDLYRKELVVSSPRAATPSDFPIAIDAVASGNVRLDGFVTHHVPVREARDAFATARTSEALKVVVDI